MRRMFGCLPLSDRSAQNAAGIKSRRSREKETASYGTLVREDSGFRDGCPEVILPVWRLGAQGAEIYFPRWQNSNAGFCALPGDGK